VKVILLEGIGNLGRLGDTVTVKPGYGRNYLLPQGKAVPATATNIEYFEHRREELEHAEKERTNVAKRRAEDLSTLHLTISARVSEEGKLYGSVGATEIVHAIQALGFEAHKQEVQLPNGPLRTLGENFEINLCLHHGHTATIKVDVIAEV
jgi:large subunit ribosomal protein L9